MSQSAMDRLQKKAAFRTREIQDATRRAPDNRSVLPVVIGVKIQRSSSWTAK